MTNVGVIGLGMMGLTHLDAYAKRSDVKVVAVSDKNVVATGRRWLAVDSALTCTFGATAKLGLLR